MNSFKYFVYMYSIVPVYGLCAVLFNNIFMSLSKKTTPVLPVKIVYRPWENPARCWRPERPKSNQRRQRRWSRDRYQFLSIALKNLYWNNSGTPRTRYSIQTHNPLEHCVEVFSSTHMSLHKRLKYCSCLYFYLLCTRVRKKQNQQLNILS